MYSGNQGGGGEALLSILHGSVVMVAEMVLNASLPRYLGVVLSLERSASSSNLFNGTVP